MYEKVVWHTFTVNPNSKNGADFLTIDKNGNVLENFFKKFIEQSKNPSHTGFFLIAQDMLDKIIKIQPADMKTIEDKVFDISGAQSGIVQYAVDTNKNIEGFYQKMVEKGTLDREDSLFNFDLIVLMHRNWLVQLRAFLDNRKAGLTASSQDHLKCDLGKWMYGDGRHLEHSATYQALESEHTQFHADAGSIIQAYNDGNKPLAEERYQKLMERYHVVVSLLDKLRNER